MTADDVIREGERLGHVYGRGAAELFMASCERCPASLDFACCDNFEAVRELRKLGPCSGRGYFEYRRPTLRELLEQAARR